MFSVKNYFLTCDFLNTCPCCFFLWRINVLILAVVYLVSQRERSLHSGMSIHFEMFCLWSSCFGVEQREWRNEGVWRRNVSNKILRHSSFIQYNVTIAALLDLCVSLPISLALSLSLPLSLFLYISLLFSYSLPYLFSIYKETSANTLGIAEMGKRLERLTLSLFMFLLFYLASN